jgi:membrane protease YdiL (CAAX protease family)
MLEKSLTNQSPLLKQLFGKFAVIMLLTLWLVVATFAASSITFLLFSGISLITSYEAAFSENVRNALQGTVVYVFLLAIFVGTPKLLRRQKNWLELLGIQRLVSWLDIGLSLAGLVFYFVAAGVVMYAVSQWFPVIDINQTQETGVASPLGYERILVFLLFVIVAPIVEELIFRGYLYGTLRRYGVSFVTTTIVVSVLFGLAHLQWNVGINVAVMSVFMCITREVSGTIWPSILIHVMKNGIAYYLLFVNPILPGVQ